MVIPSDSHGPHPSAYRRCIPEEAQCLKLSLMMIVWLELLEPDGRVLRTSKIDDRQASCLRLI